jgi:surfactin family lipopeptide synthetase C
LTEQLEKLARKEQVTLNTVAQSAWALLLSRYSGEEEVVYGVTVSGRPAELPGVETMVGLFINTLPVRVKVKGAERVGDWMRRIQADQVEMRQYEYSPLASVQGWSGAPKGIPLFESIVVFENYPVNRYLEERLNPRLHIRDVAYNSKNNNPISIVVVPGQKLLLQIQYDYCYFDPTSIDELLWHFENLLAEFVAIVDPRVVHMIEALDKADQQQQLKKEHELEDASASKFQKGRRRSGREPK